MRISGDMYAAVMLLNSAIKEMMGDSSRQTPENDEIFEKYLRSVEKEYMLTIGETYLVGRMSNYPANWITWRHIANGRYRKAFEILRENNMKKNYLKRLIRESIAELQEDHGLGFGHNVSLPQDANTMNKPTIKEYGDANARARAIDSSDFERASALLYKWSEGGQIDFKEFRFLLQHFIQKSK